MKSLRVTLSKYSPAEFAAGIRQYFADSAHLNILAGVGYSLVLQDKVLINTQSGEYREVIDEAEQTREVALAKAARQLIPASAQNPSVLLLLPPGDFLSSRYQLGLRAENAMRSAVSLQAHTLIPSFDAELLLGINGQHSEGVALWYPARAADALFVAFEAEHLLLAALMPRSLALVDEQQGDVILQDDDSVHLTQQEWRGNALRSFLVVSRQDLEDPAFAEQWQQEINKALPAQRLRSSGRESWDNKRCVIAANEMYSFFPKGAEQHGRRLLLKKQKRFAGKAVAFAALLLLLPFVINWGQSAWLTMQVNQLREASTDARRSQAAVYALEDEWGVITDFPRQNVPEVLLALNQHINSSLSTFALNKGVVDLSGYSKDPALLVEQLAENEKFHEVSQSRSSSGTDNNNRGDRFGIRLNLGGVDFKGYESKYPPVKQ